MNPEKGVERFLSFLFSQFVFSQNPEKGVESHCYPDFSGLDVLVKNPEKGVESMTTSL